MRDEMFFCSFCVCVSSAFVSFLVWSIVIIYFRNILLKYVDLIWNVNKSAH